MPLLAPAAPGKVRWRAKVRGLHAIKLDLPETAWRALSNSGAQGRGTTQFHRRTTQNSSQNVAEPSRLAQGRLPSFFQPRARRRRLLEPARMGIPLDRLDDKLGRVPRSWAILLATWGCSLSIKDIRLSSQVLSGRHVPLPPRQGHLSTRRSAAGLPSPVTSRVVSTRDFPSSLYHDPAPSKPNPAGAPCPAVVLLFATFVRFRHSNLAFGINSNKVNHCWAPAGIRPSKAHRFRPVDGADHRGRLREGKSSTYRKTHAHG